MKKEKKEKDSVIKFVAGLVIIVITSTTVGLIVSNTVGRLLLEDK